MSLLWSSSPRSVESRSSATMDTCADLLRGTEGVRPFAKQIQNPTHAYPAFVQANLEAGS